MVRISISPAAFDAICATMPLGSVGYEREADAAGEVAVWLEAAVVNRLAAMRGPGEGFSDVILRLCEAEAAGRPPARPRTGRTQAPR